MVCTRRKDRTIEKGNVLTSFMADELERRVVSHIATSSPQMEAFAAESFVSAKSKFGGIRGTYGVASISSSSSPRSFFARVEATI